MTVEELFGTLQQSVIATWRKHLKTKKYSNHMALDEYYKDAPELIDALIEAWQGTHDKIENYVNLLDGKEFETAVDYLNALRDIVKEGRDLMDSSELESDVDSILSMIDGVIYKLKELKEDSEITKYFKSHICESKTTLGEIADYTESWTRQEFDDKGIRNVLVAMTNGAYRALSERAVANWASEKEKNIANKWLDIIEKMYAALN